MSSNVSHMSASHVSMSGAGGNFSASSVEKVDAQSSHQPKSAPPMHPPAGDDPSMGMGGGGGGGQSQGAGGSGDMLKELMQLLKALMGGEGGQAGGPGGDPMSQGPGGPGAMMG